MRARLSLGAVAVLTGLLLLATPAYALTATTTFPTRSGQSATLYGEFDPEGVELTECFFEYGETTGYGHTVECEGNWTAFPGSKANSHSVHAQISGLAVGHTYHYRLVAANAAPETKLGSDQAFIAAASHAFSASFAGADADALLNPTSVAIDQSTGDVYVANASSNQRQTITVHATGGAFTLAFRGHTTTAIPFDAPASGPGSVQAALDALPGIISFAYNSNTLVSGDPGGPYTVEFVNALSGAEQPPITTDPSGLTGGASTATVATTAPGGVGPDIEKFTPSGEFLLMFGKEVNRTEAEAVKAIEARGEAPTEAQLQAANVCESGEDCQPGSAGSAPGAFEGRYSNYSHVGNALFLSVDNSPSGEGDVYVGDPGDNLVSKFDSEGHLIASWSHDGQLDGRGVPGGRFGAVLALSGVAVKPDGTLVVAGQSNYFYEFAPNGAFLAGGEALGVNGGVGGIAADAGGDVYAANPESTEGTALFAWELKLVPGTVYHAEEPYFHRLEYQRVLLQPSGLAIDPSSRALFVSVRGGEVLHLSPSCWESSCQPLDTFGAGQLDNPQGLAVDSATGVVYVADSGDHRVAVFAAAPFLPAARPSSATALTASSATLGATVNPAAAGPITGCQVQYGPQPANERQTLTLGALGAGDLTSGSREVTDLATSTGAFLVGETIAAPGYVPAETKITAVKGGRLVLSAPAEATALAVPLSARPSAGAFTLGFEGRATEAIPFDASDPKLEEALASVVGEGAHGGANVEVTGSPGGPYRVEFIGSLADTDVPQLTASSSGLSPSGAAVTPATLTDGQPASWVAAATASCGPSLPIESEAQLSVPLSGLAYATTYRFRLLAENEYGAYASFAETFTTLPHAPAVDSDSATRVYADAAQIDAQVDPGGGATAYRVEYVDQEDFNNGEFEHAAKGPSLSAGSARTPQSLTAQLGGLTPDTVYHYRVTATNECEAGVECVAEGPAHTFTTLPEAIPANDACPNAHVRQQTGAAQLLDCRAYELVSAPYTAGYDVESNLVEGQAPFAGYPQATAPDGEPRVLYGIHDGGIPGLGEPTNRGVDPYLATRTPEGWRSEYVGLPSNLDPASPPFGSPLLAADRSLEVFAFGGEGLCSPCFGAGLEAGVPLRLPGSETPVQGMAPAAGLTPPATAGDEGDIAAPLSANGEHLIFGSTSKFAAGGNEDGEVSIYDRDLTTGETHVVSNAPGEGAVEPLACLQGAGKCDAAEGDANGISELALSANGSHVLLGQKVSEDADGNAYWRLYMDIDDSLHTLEVTPGATDGVLFAGMTEDGSEVFFTTADQLLSADTDHSADLYMWSRRGEEEGQPLTLLSTGEGATGDTDSCNPVAGPGGTHWNTVGSEPNCGVVAIGGGGGVAPASGAIYFLSPEKLAGSAGAKNRPNLYLSVPGEAPRFIATLSPEDPLVLDAVSESGARHTADFQVTPDGRFAAFPSTLALAGKGEETAERSEVYRYDVATEALACASCTLTGLPSEGESSLASDGLSLTEDGRLFFNSSAPLVATDTDETQDAYEWEKNGTGGCSESTPSYSEATESCRALISAGTGASPSGLLSASESGRDVYFFTRGKLAEEDENGATAKVYDAREGGGFPYLFPPEGCKASDECHGPASPTPPPIEAGSEAGTPHNFTAEEPAKPVTCKKGYVKKHGRCVKKPHHHKRHRHHHKSAHHKRGGEK